MFANGKNVIPRAVGITLVMLVIRWLSGESDAAAVGGNRGTTSKTTQRVRALQAGESFSGVFDFGMRRVFPDQLLVATLSLVDITENFETASSFEVRQRGPFFVVVDKRGFQKVFGRVLVFLLSEQALANHEASFRCGFGIGFVGNFFVLLHGLWKPVFVL